VDRPVPHRRGAGQPPARRSFGGDLREAEDFALKVEHDKRARAFVDLRDGQAPFRAEAAAWLGQHLGADTSIKTYQSVLNAHINPAFGIPRSRCSAGRTSRP
jgi:hypothetical protein